MKKPSSEFLPILTLGAVAAVGVMALGAWLAALPPPRVETRVPGLDSPESEEESVASKIPESGQLTTGQGKPADLPGSWPWFRGKALDNIGQPGVPLARRWLAEGPKVLWSVDLGEGYAGPIVQDGRVWLLDYDRENSADALRCLSLADGKEIWRFSYPAAIKRNHGMSRTVPAISGKDSPVAPVPLRGKALEDAMSRQAQAERERQARVKVRTRRAACR